MANTTLPPSAQPADPLRAAKWLQISLNARKRTHVKFVQDFGADSPAALAVGAECAEIQNTITALLKEAANAPLRK